MRHVLVVLCVVAAVGAYAPAGHAEDAFWYCAEVSGVVGPGWLLPTSDTESEGCSMEVAPGEFGFGVAWERLTTAEVRLELVVEGSEQTILRCRVQRGLLLSPCTEGSFTQNVTYDDALQGPVSSAFDIGESGRLRVVTGSLGVPDESPVIHQHGGVLSHALCSDAPCPAPSLS